MNIVLDTNVVMSALIRDSITRAIILMSENNFYYPEKSMEELGKHQSLIIDKSRISEHDYYTIKQVLFNKIILVNEKDINPFLPKAQEIMGKIDFDDIIFIACALAIPNDGIWSDDKHFEKQDNVRIWKTKDILRLYYINRCEH